MRSTTLAVLASMLLLAGCGAGGGQSAPPAAELDSGGWSTDFSRRTVPLEEFMSGGPGKDGIPAIDRPRFVGLAAGERRPAARRGAGPTAQRRSVLVRPGGLLPGGAHPSFGTF
jgi:hypothetical protein